MLVSLERDIYKIYLEGPYDWLNPVDMFTDFYRHFIGLMDQQVSRR